MANQVSLDFDNEQLDLFEPDCRYSEYSLNVFEGSFEEGCLPDTVFDSFHDTRVQIDRLTFKDIGNYHIETNEDLPLQTQAFIEF